MASAKQLKLSERLLVLTINVIVFLILNWWLSGLPLPGLGIENLWLVSAVSLWFLSLITSPWFLPPRDALAASVTGFIVAVTLDFSATWFSQELNAARLFVLCFSILLIIVSCVAIVLHEKSPSLPITKLLFRISNEFGKPEILFTLIALIGMVAVYANDPVKLAVLSGFWVIFISLRPIETLWYLIKAAVNDGKLEVKSSSGTILRVDHPSLFRVSLMSHKDWKPGTLKVASLPDGSQEYVIALFSQTQGSQIVGTGLSVAEVAEEIELQPGAVVDSHNPEAAKAFLERLSGVEGATLVGFCVENTEISQLRFEAANGDALYDGAIVFSNVRGKPVFYQIIEARTSEESFDQNPKGSQIVTAVQLGEYDPARGFSKFAWLPEMNAPVFFSGSDEFDVSDLDDSEIEIGRLPGVSVPIKAKFEDLVTHHIAVLGSTGTGKTEFAFDVIESLLDKGVKVLCVDFTGDYRTRFADKYNTTALGPTEAQGSDLEAKLFDVETGKFNAADEKRVLHEALQSMRATAEAEIQSFITSADSKLAIFELAEIANSQASLRITELYLSSAMRYAKANRDFGKLLIVLEEAHTIVPESRGAGFDFPTQAIVSRIGQIALQGRKYGIGLMVISQRTALVSKTILSQCNAFFVFSLLDATSISFLESVFSAQQTRLIPNLKRFHALIGGKSLSAERPVVIDRTRP